MKNYEKLFPEQTLLALDFFMPVERDIDIDEGRKEMKKIIPRWNFRRIVSEKEGTPKSGDARHIFAVPTYLPTYVDQS